MKKVDFNKLQAGDLVEVPRTQFAPMRSGWNGWLFSEAVVIRKGVGRKSKKNVVVVEMRTPAGKNSYGTIEATFYAENVFTTPVAKNARNILKKYGIEDAESFYKFIERDDVTGCDWIRFSERLCRCHSRYAKEKRAEAAAGQAKKARRWYFIKQKAYGLAMLAVTVLAAWATEGDITIAVITVPLGLMCLFSKKMLIVDNYYFATEERAIHGRKNNTAY